MLKKLFIINLVFFLAIFIYLGKNTFIKAANCVANCTTKEIGTLGKDVFGRDVLNHIDPVEVGKSYWVKLTVKGRDSTSNTAPTSAPSATPTTTTLGSDIMLMLDTTSSMFDPIPVNKNGGGGTILTYLAVRDGLNRMVSLSDEGKDYVGLGSFRYCRDYSTAQVPISWVYEDWSQTDNQYRGFGALHLPLQKLNKTLFSNAINSIGVGNDGSNNNFCRSFGASGTGGTSVGAAITIGNTQLTPILNDSKSVRRDGTSYRNSSKVGINGYNDGPRNRSNIPKYIVLATDGQEGSKPFVDDTEIDKNLRSILQTAIYYNVKIYSIAFSKPGNAGYQKLERLASTTGGRIFSGTSRQEILEAVESIRNEITDNSQGNASPHPSPSSSSSGTSATVTERINTNNFNIPSLSTNTFKLIKKNPDGSLTDITTTCGASLNNCLTSRSGSGFDLKLPPISANEEIYIYFMVNPTTTSPSGQKVPVDKDPDSKVRYSNGHEEGVNNVQVGVVANKPYFEAQNGGNVHSAGGLSVDMPAGNNFIRGTSPGILSYSGNAVIRPNSNQLSTKNWKVGGFPGYSINSQRFSYTSMLSAIKNVQSISNLSEVTASGFYLYEGELTINSTNPLPNLKVPSTQIVLMVSGNVYIRTSIQIFGNTANKSSLAIISSKNIGIGTNVNDDSNGVLDGIYIADGVIDTACDTTFIFDQCSPTSPNMANSSLTLQGMFLGHSGFNLDRQGQPTAPKAGEKFIYKPELLLNAAPQLGTLSSVWREVTP